MTASLDSPRYWQRWTDATSTEQTLDVLIRRKHREAFQHETCNRPDCNEHPETSLAITPDGGK